MLEELEARLSVLPLMDAARAGFLKAKEKYIGEQIESLGHHQRDLSAQYARLRARHNAMAQAMGRLEVEALQAEMRTVAAALQEVTRTLQRVMAESSHRVTSTHL